MSLLAALQKALMDRLKADAGVMAFVGQRIFDGIAPPGAILPYARVGSHTEVPFNVIGTDGWSDTLVVDSFWPTYQAGNSNRDSSAEAMAFVSAVNAAVKQPLTLDGHHSASLKPEMSNPAPDPNEKIRRWMTRYRITTFEAA